MGQSRENNTKPYHPIRPLIMLNKDTWADIQITISGKYNLPGQLPYLYKRPKADKSISKAPQTIQSLIYVSVITVFFDH
ncbi:MAG: hypothetical protein CM1200mP15_07570 [Dehalococcoidia bacterium]|nr:MAG: hypothetical protein CM1200mP15_07570 [Dehalococcoidia bacterium]